MLTEERHQLILELLAQETIVKLQDFVEETGSSESTIRRDLSVLESQGLLARIHGGAKRIYNVSAEAKMEEKTVKNTQEKKAIARCAADLVKDGDVVFLDAGSTTYEMIPFLNGKRVLVITNGVPHASLLADLQIETILIGGKIKLQTKAVIGADSQKQLQMYRFSKAFLGINGIDFQYGYTTPDVEEAAIKRLAIQNAAQSFVLADLSKINQVSFAKVGDIESCNLVISRLPKDLKNKLESYTNILEAES